MDLNFSLLENKDLFFKLINECCDDLIEKKLKCDTKKETFNCSEEEIKKITSYIKKIYVDTTLSKKDIKSVLKLSSLSSEIQSCLEEIYNIRKDEIEHFLFKKELSKSNHLIVENFDWKLKWIMGSSTLCSLREPVLQLQIHCIKRSEDTNRPLIEFEMDLEKIKYLISQLENAQKTFNSIDNCKN